MLIIFSYLKAKMSAHLQERKKKQYKKWRKYARSPVHNLKSYDTKPKLTSYQTNYFTPTSLSITETHHLPGMLIQKAKDTMKPTTVVMTVNHICSTSRRWCEINVRTNYHKSPCYHSEGMSSTSPTSVTIASFIEYVILNFRRIFSCGNNIETFITIYPRILIYRN